MAPPPGPSPSASALAAKASPAPPKDPALWVRSRSNGLCAGDDLELEGEGMRGQVLEVHFDRFNSGKPPGPLPGVVRTLVATAPVNPDGSFSTKLRLHNPMPGFGEPSQYLMRVGNSVIVEVSSSDGEASTVAGNVFNFCASR